MSDLQEGLDQYGIRTQTHGDRPVEFLVEIETGKLTRLYVIPEPEQG